MIKKIIKQILRPFIKKWLVPFLEKQKQNRLINKSTEGVFTYIYNKNLWGDKESVSGSGSNIDQAKNIIDPLNTLLKRYDITSLLDVPCGDFNWMRNVDLEGIRYTGGDIVPQLIEDNRNKYKKSGVEFHVINIITDELPKVDLLFCRDCFVHLSINQILESLTNIKNNNIKYLLTTSFAELQKNNDIKTGSWRPLNLEIEPFNLKTVEIINEGCTEGGGCMLTKA